MQNQLNIIANHLITYNYLSDASSEVISAELEQLSNLYDGRVMIINSGLKVIKDTYGTSEGKTVITEEVIRCMKGGTGGANYDYEYGYIEITTPIIETATAEMAVNNGAPAGMEKKKDIVRGVMLTSVSTGKHQYDVRYIEQAGIAVGNVDAACNFCYCLIAFQCVDETF